MSNPRKKASLYLFCGQAQCLFTVVQYIVELEFKVRDYDRFHDPLVFPCLFICIYLAVEYTRLVINKYKMMKEIN